MVKLEIEPGEAGSGVTFESSVTAGKIPKDFQRAVEQGVMESAESGAIAGYPVVDIKTQEVIRVDDHGVVPIPMEMHEYGTKLQERVRADLRPINVVRSLPSQ